METIKEELKKIIWLRKIVRALKMELFQVKRCFTRCAALYYISKKKNDFAKKIKVGILAQCVASWDKLEPLYDFLIQDYRFETFLFVVPEDNFETYEIIPDYEGNYFCEKYPNHIKLLDKSGNCIDLADYNLNYLFYQRPYDYRLPKLVRSSRMVKYTQCCYLPYGLTASDAFNDNNLRNDFFDNQCLLFMDSPYMQGLLKKRYPLSHLWSIKKIEYLGYPALDKYILWGKTEKSEGYITWTPRWSFDSRKGESSFLKYKDRYFEYVSKNKGKYIFRPHPLIRAEIVNRNIMSKEEWDTYICALEELGVVVDMDSPIDNVLRKTEILITDFSTIIGNFMMLGRPIIYCDNSIQLNPVYEEMEKYFYKAFDWSTVEKICNDLIRGTDVMKSARQQFIEEKYEPLMGASNRIAKYMVEDAKARGWRET